jgi:TPR repeat protein
MDKKYPWPVKVIVGVSIIGLAFYFGLSDSAEDTSSDASAQFERGLRYYCGDGVPVDYSKAAELYRKAADQGHAIAQCNLGSMYANGLGVPEDEVEAVTWFRKSAEQGYDGAQCIMALCMPKVSVFRRMKLSDLSILRNGT